MSLSFYCCVHCGLDLCKNRVRRQHLTVFIRTIYAYELRVAFALLPVDVAYLDLELNVRFMDVLSTFKILSVCSATLALELRLYKSDRDVKEDVQVWNR